MSRQIPQWCIGVVILAPLVVLNKVIGWFK